jgi:hypothetical protein
MPGHVIFHYYQQDLTKIKNSSVPDNYIKKVIINHEKYFHLNNLFLY